MTCKSCAHWIEQTPESGRCAQKPPMATLVPQQGIGGQGLAVITYWPETRPTDHCGSYTSVVEKTSNLLQS